MNKKKMEQIINDFTDFIGDFFKANFEDLRGNTKDFRGCFDFTSNYENYDDIIKALLPLVVYQWELDSNEEAVEELKKIES